MKYLTIFILGLALTGCSDWEPMSESESKAFQACLEKGWTPDFQATTSSRKLSCTEPSR